MYLASVLEREYVVELYELQMIQGRFCCISCGRKWHSVFYGRIFSGKKMLSSLTSLHLLYKHVESEDEGICSCAHKSYG